jgi:Fungal specific transcription factor domain/Fungal Zn(2)-Cys(6) binuclear cluster domain
MRHAPLLPSFETMEEYDHSEQNDESDVSDSIEVSNNTQHHGQRKARGGNACLTCRRMKTRCEYFDDASPCKLCAKSNRECVKAPPRQKRRKTVTRIADLEQRIQSLTSALIDKSPVDRKSIPHDGADFQTASNTREAEHSAANTESCTRPASITPDVIDKGIVDKVTGFAAFHRYRERQDLYYGFVPLPRDMDVDKYRRQKPLLFSTLVLAGINSIRPDLVEPIAQDVVKLYADRIHLRAERSLEIVQSLLIYVCFHCRTLKREHLTFYQNISTALTMALDLGLGRRMGKNLKPRWIAEEDVMDARRAYLGCYYMAGQAGISMRQPIFIRWGPYIEECLEVISTNPQPARDDGWLVELIRLHRIAEDAHYTFSMDDPASTLSLKDPKTQYHLHALEQQLERWRRESTSDLSDLRARLCVACVNLFIHEIALHSHQSIDSLRSPPDPEHLAAFFNDMDIGPARIDALCTCLASARSYLDSLLSLDIDTLRCLPNVSLPFS